MSGLKMGDTYCSLFHQHHVKNCQFSFVTKRCWSSLKSIQYICVYAYHELHFITSECVSRQAVLFYFIIFFVYFACFMHLLCASVWDVWTLECISASFKSINTAIRIQHRARKKCRLHVSLLYLHFRFFFVSYTSSQTRRERLKGEINCFILNTVVLSHIKCLDMLLEPRKNIFIWAFRSQPKQYFKSN